MECVWLNGEKRKGMIGSECFLSGPSKTFLFKMGEKTREKKSVWYMHLKIKNICLKTCIKICVDEKIYKNSCNVI